VGRAVTRALVDGLVGVGVARRLAAVVAVAERPVGVEGHAAVRRVAQLRRREGVALGVRVVGEHAGRRAVEHRDRAALGDGGAVVAGGRGVVYGSDRKRDRGRAAALAVGRAVGRPVVTGLVGEGVAGGLAAVVAVAERPVGVERHAAVGRGTELGRREGVALGVRVVGEHAGCPVSLHGALPVFGDGGAVVVGGRGVVHGSDRKRDHGRRGFNRVNISDHVSERVVPVVVREWSVG